MVNLQTGVAVDGVVNLINEINYWATRILVLLSLVAHVVLAVLAGIRRREAASLWRTLLWLSYQVPDRAAPYVLGKLTFGGTSREQRLLSLWVPFLLMHLGGPDNITAYSLEDDILSSREWIKIIAHLLGTPLAIYKQHVACGGDGALFWSSVAMAVVGAAKYWERVIALQEGKFSKIRSSGKNQQPKSLRVQLPRCWNWKKKLDDEQALLVAHELLHITKGAFADYFVDEDLLKKDSNLKKIFSVVEDDGHGWKNIGKVVEMELSLMFDILYTKAAVTHTWEGYVIRVTSLVATGTTTLLFWLYYSKDRQRIADVIITYILLVVTLLLDVRWLLRAVASTWTYAFLNARPECWLHHEVLCTGRWHRLRHAIVSLDLRRWVLPRGPDGSYRLWSGTIGQYNLLHECTNDTTSSFSKVVKKVISEETWMEYKYSKGHTSQKIRELLFKQIAESFKFWGPPPPPPPTPAPPAPPPPPPAAAPPRPPPPYDEDFRRHRRLDEALDFLPEFQELILIWHVATDIFLWDNYQELKNWQEYVDTIKVMSDYMVFLVAARPDMLPGLKLRSLYDVTSEALKWIRDNPDSSWSSIEATTKEQQLARFLLHMENKPGNESDLYHINLLLSDGTKFAKVLNKWLRTDTFDWYQIRDTVKIGKDFEKRILFLVPEMERRKGWMPIPLRLRLILQSWVRMLIFVSTRCSRDSHAKQLGRGCELTTIVWILSDHAGIFGHEGRKKKHS